MKREDVAVLVNLERIRATLMEQQRKEGGVKWDLERAHLEGQNLFLKEENN